MGPNYPVLKKLFNEINTTGLTVTVAGHTDTKGNPDANMKLSEARAISVRDYFISKGMPAERFRVEYYGQTQPVGSNDAENRRVVIELGSK